jgi:hypothetical protein
MPFFLVYVASCISISAGVYGLFNKAGDSVSDKTKRSVSKWLQNIKLTQDSPRWPGVFAQLFDRVFTEHHLSWKCFVRSCIASIAAVLVMTAVYIIVSRVPLMGGSEQTGGLHLMVVGMLLYAVLFNFVADYISLLESRYIIGKMSKTQSGRQWFILLFVDIILTAAIFIVTGCLIFSLITLIQGRIPNLIRWLSLIGYGLTLNIMSEDSSLGLMGIFFYSTFFTSAWVWGYAISGFLIKAISRTRRGLQFLLKNLDIEHKPFKSMGFILIVAISAGYLVGAVVLLTQAIFF